MNEVIYWRVAIDVGQFGLSGCDGTDLKECIHHTAGNHKQIFDLDEKERMTESVCIEEGKEANRVFPRIRRRGQAHRQCMQGKGRKKAGLTMLCRQKQDGGGGRSEQDETVRQTIWVK